MNIRFFTKVRYFWSAKFLLKILLLCWTCLVSHQGGASVYTYLKGPPKPVNVPFRLVHNLIIIKLQISTSDSLNFILDSGVKTALLFGLPHGSMVSFDVTHKYKIEGLGKNEPVEAYYSPKNLVVFADYISNNQDFMILPTDLLDLSAFLGIEIHGLIGYDFLENFQITIDYIHRQLTIVPHTTVKQKPVGFQEISLTIEGKRAFVHCLISDSKGRIHPAKMMLDLGASLSLALFRHTLPGFSLPAKSFESFLGRGIQGDVYGKIGRLNHLVLGVFEFENPVSFFPHPEFIAYIATDQGRNGSIGADFLVRFKVILDYAQQKLYLRPNKLYSRDFGYNITGIEIIAPLGEIPVYEVAAVRRGSEAEKVGLLPGDQIRLINGQNVAQMDMNEMILWIQGYLSKTLKITVLRGNQFIKFRIPVYDITL